LNQGDLFGRNDGFGFDEFDLINKNSCAIGLLYEGPLDRSGA
jgi:hypothetical protein